jgi:hypothetical protein
MNLHIIARIFHRLLHRKEETVDKFAYRRGYDDAEKGRTENPYSRGSVLYTSWQKGFKAQEDYELNVW